MDRSSSKPIMAATLKVALMAFGKTKYAAEEGENSLVGETSRMAEGSHVDISAAEVQKN